MKPTPRSQAARVIGEVLGGASLNKVLDARINTLAIEQKPLCRELIYGTLREWPRIDAVLAQLLDKPLRERDNDVRGLLGCGVYQLQHMRVPSHAAVSETVNATAALGKGWARRLVNGVLRNVQRRSEQLDAPLTAAARDALPGWLSEALATQWPNAYPQIVAASRSRPPMHLRVGRGHGGRDAALARLVDADIDARPHPLVETAIVLENGLDVTDIPGFSEGVFSVQDASAQLAASLLSPTEDEHVLDACAAPGGKACHLAEMMLTPGHLVAADSAADRLAKITANRERLGLEFTVLQSDARAPSSRLQPGSFTAILADVPCSATGVLRRNPDIKVIRAAADIKRFNALQREILSGLWPLLAAGGRLLYSTCSLLEAENDAIVRWALDVLPGARSLPLTHPQAVPTQLGIQCLPSQSEGDGLYYAMLHRDAGLR